MCSEVEVQRFSHEIPVKVMFHFQQLVLHDTEQTQNVSYFNDPLLNVN